MFDPVFVRRVEAIARGKVEPRILRSGPGFDPLFALGASRDRGKCLFDRAVHQRGVDAGLDRETRQLFQFVVGPEQIDVDALNHAGDGLIRNVGKLLFAETKEIEIRRVTEIEKLKMILPGLVAKLHTRFVVLDQIVRVVETRGLPKSIPSGPCPATVQIAAPPSRR